MEDEGRHAVLDDGDVLLPPWHGFADHRSTYAAGDGHRGNAGERRLPRSEDRPVDRKLGAVAAAGAARPPRVFRVPPTLGEDRAATLYRSAGSRPAEPDAATPVG